jgi:hypothetical protein
MYTCRYPQTARAVGFKRCHPNNNTHFQAFPPKMEEKICIVLNFLFSLCKMRNEKQTNQQQSETQTTNKQDKKKIREEMQTQK